MSAGLFYDSLGSDIGAEMAFLEANRLNIQQAREAEQEKERKEKEKEKEKVTESTDSGKTLCVSFGYIG